MENNMLVTPAQFKFLADVSAERDRQKQLYDNSKKNMDALLTVMVEEVGEVAKAIQDNNDKNLYEELTHAAAVCLQMAERI